MKHYAFLVFTSLAFFGFSQTNTEIFLSNISHSNNNYIISTIINLSNNTGYDNQPSFLDDRYILFSSTRNKQTDIAKYDTYNNTKQWLNYSEGGEYSPLKIPNKNEVSAVKLDKKGKQRLYAYSINNGESTELIKDLVVAYYTWADKKTIVSAVIEAEDLNLYTTNVKSGKSQKHDIKVGRSFHKIPNTNLVSFISKANENQWHIKSLNPCTGAIKFLANTLKGVEDICWLDSSTILSSNGSIIYKQQLKQDKTWKKIANLSVYDITKISRLATNTVGTKLLIAGEFEDTKK